MKIAIALACLLAIATAVEETKKVDQIVDLEAAENRHSGGQRYGGNGGRYGGGHGGGHPRKGRSVEEDQPLVVEEIQPIVESVSDLELAENAYGGGYGGGHRGGYSGGHGGGHGGYHNRRGRSVEEDQPLVLEEIQSIVDSVSDLELAENRYGGYGSRGYGGYGGGHHGGYSGGYGGGYGNRGGWGRHRRSVEDLEAAEHRRGGYSGGYGSNSGGHRSGYGNSGFNRPSSGGYGGGHGHGRY